MYAKITDNTLAQYPYTAEQLRRDNPSTAFGAVLSDDTLAAFGVVRVITSAAPDYNPATHALTELDPTQTVDGWATSWQVTPLTAEQIAVNAAASGARLQLEVVAASQARLDDFARTRNYDGILSACTYASSTVPRFAAEGQAAVDLRDSTWATLYTIMGEVMAGTRPMPAGFADVEPLLPALVWPT